MTKYLILVLLSFCIVVYSQNTDPTCQPNGIKLSLGDNFDLSTQYDKEKLLKATRHDYTITYFTKANCPKNYCEVYTSLDLKVKYTLSPVQIKRFFQPKDTSGIPKTETRTEDFEMYIYEYQLDASILKFKPDSIIQYKCFYLSDDNPQQLKNKGPFEFYHIDYSKLKQREFKFAWVADYDINPNAKYGNRQFGKDNMYIMDKYIKQERKSFVGIIAGGDYAYDMNDDSGQRGVNFLKAGEFSYATIPYVTIAGNHEEWYNYSYYKSFFRNPRSSISESDYYTLTIGDLLLVGMNTNKYIKDPATNKNIGIDKQWLQQLYKWFDDTMTEMKGKYRWSIVYSHQNIYCFEDFETSACYSNPQIFSELEDLLNKHKVDIYLAGHVHAYERIQPNYKGQAKFKQTEQCQMKNCSLYESPQAPVYVVDGSGGTYHYFPKDSGYPGGQLTVTSDRTLGFSTVTVKNSTHLVFEHILSDTLEVFDSFTIYKPLVNEAGIEDNKQNVQYINENENEDEHKKMYIIFFVILGVIAACNLIAFLWFKIKLDNKIHQKVQIRQNDTEKMAVISTNQL
ncbi:hypothetical protein ABPG74_009668 [Tetrahymena malaccensis]